MIVYKIQRIDKGKTYEIAIFRHKGTDEYSFINLTKGHICPCRFKSYEAAIEELDSQPNVKVLDFRHISPEGFFESELRSHIIGSVVTESHMYYSPIAECAFGPAVAESQAQQDLIRELVTKIYEEGFADITKQRQGDFIVYKAMIHAVHPRTIASLRCQQFKKDWEESFAKSVAELTDNDKKD